MIEIEIACRKVMTSKRGAGRSYHFAITIDNFSVLSECEYDSLKEAEAAGNGFVIMLQKGRIKTITNKKSACNLYKNGP